MIVMELSKTQFSDVFHKAGRGNKFSYEAIETLYDLLDDLYHDDETGPYYLDVVGLCCEFSEDTLKNILKDYDLENFEELTDNTTAIELSNGNILYQCY